MSDKIVEGIVEGIVENHNLINEVYKDVLQPGLRVGGKAGEDLLKFVALPFSFLGMTAEQLEEKYKKFIEKTLEKVPEERREKPKAIVVSPLLEYIKYMFDDENDGELIDMFSNLIAKSIDQESKNTVHVSYVDTLKQIGAIEAKILNKMYEMDDYSSLGIAFRRNVEVDSSYIEVMSDEAEPLYGENKNVFFYYSIFIVDDEIQVSDSSFNNALNILRHHNLIKSFSVNKLAGKDSYTLEKHGKDNLTEIDPYGSFIGYALTPYGKDFMSVCINPIEDIHSTFRCKDCNVTFQNIRKNGICSRCGKVAKLII